MSDNSETNLTSWS